MIILTAPLEYQSTLRHLKKLGEKNYGNFISTNKFSFKTELLKGLHSFDTSGATPAGNVFKIALYNSSADLGTTTTAYTTTEELATATGYTRPGNTLTNTGVGTTTVTSFTDFSDTSWTSASFTARGCLIYNSSSVTGLTTDSSSLFY